MRAADLARTHRERLVRNGFLLPVMKGWYIAGSPDRGAGDSTAWYTSFWGFCADYLRCRLDTDWCLSPEQSLSLHAGNWSVPRQLLVRAPKGRNNVTILPHGTSVLEVRSTMPDVFDIVEVEGMRVFSLPAALVACSARYFSRSPVDVRTALALVHDIPDMLRRLLAGSHSTVAGRLAGAFRGMGRTRIANDIVGGMRAAGFTVRESDPFGCQPPYSEPAEGFQPASIALASCGRRCGAVIPNTFPARRDVCQGRRETRPKGGAKHCHRGLRGEMVRGGRDEAGGGVSRKRREGVARPQFPAGGDAQVRSSSPCFARGCG